MVWIWNEQLKALGFRKKSRRYWQCQQRYGLTGSDHISAFLWCEERLPHSPIACYEWCEFHVTFEIGGHNLHFYYHELQDNHWYPAGRTSRREIERLGEDARQLQWKAHAIAEALVSRWGAEFHHRQRE